MAEDCVKQEHLSLVYFYLENKILGQTLDMTMMTSELVLEAGESWSL